MQVKKQRGLWLCALPSFISWYFTRTWIDTLALAHLSALLHTSKHHRMLLSFPFWDVAWRDCGLEVESCSSAIVQHLHTFAPTCSSSWIPKSSTELTYFMPYLSTTSLASTQFNHLKKAFKDFLEIERTLFFTGISGSGYKSTTPVLPHHLAHHSNTPNQPLVTHLYTGCSLIGSATRSLHSSLLDSLAARSGLHIETLLLPVLTLFLPCLASRRSRGPRAELQPWHPITTMPWRAFCLLYWSRNASKMCASGFCVCDLIRCVADGPADRLEHGRSWSHPYPRDHKRPCR